LNTLAMAEAYVKDARRSLREAQLSREEGAYHRCVRRAQECVELALKGVLRLLGIEYPRSHDVSQALELARPSMPEWLAQRVDDLKRASLKLAEERGPAFYGDERAYVPPEQLYGEEDAEEALRMAREALEAAERLLSEFKERAASEGF